MVSNGDSHHLYIPGVDTKLMLPMELNVRGIEKLLAQLKVTKASSPGNIPSTLLKDGSGIVACYLLIIIFKSISEHTFLME